jgi:hypothetical protein
LNATSSYVCEQCADVTTGDALCPPCLQGLERAAHAARKRDSDRAREAIDLASVLRERLRRHLAAKCDHRARNPSLVADLMDTERASAEIVGGLSVLAELARTAGAKR